MNTGKTWPERLMSMESGQAKNFPWEKRRTIRGAISDRIKNDFPEFEFATNKVFVKESLDSGVTAIRTYLQVRRVK